MRILVVDDDRMFSEPVVWRLQEEKYDVVYCQSVSEVLSGWIEITEHTLAHLESEGVPEEIIERLRELVGDRFETEAEFQRHANRKFTVETALVYVEKAMASARQNALNPPPDCILMDLMMPRSDYYTRKRTRAGQYTGAVLLEDILKKIGDVPTIICTVRRETGLEGDLRQRFRSLRHFLIKPVTPSEIVRRLNEMFPDAPGDGS